MSYATTTDLNMRFGTQNIAKWADLEGDASQVTVRTAYALQVADDLIDSMLKGKFYQVPLSFTSETCTRRVAQWAVTLAGHWLYFCRGQLGTESEKDAQGVALNALYKNIVEEITKIANGTMVLDGVARWAPNPRAPTPIM